MHVVLLLHIIILLQTETDPGNATDTDQAIDKACDLLGHYYLLNGSGIFNNSNILHIVLKQNVLDACTHWVSANTCFHACLLYIVRTCQLQLI